MKNNYIVNEKQVLDIKQVKSNYSKSGYSQYFVLSDMSEGFIASDIAYVVNDAAMIAAFTDQEITEELLETSVKNTHPSLRVDTLEVYDDIRRKMEDTERRSLARRKIGFV